MPKIAKAQGRSVEEWIGKTPDSKAPPHVELRIWRRWNGKCHITGRKIMPGDDYQIDHIKRLEDGGENRESNMAPALSDPHKEKTSAERDRAKKADAMARSHLGIGKEPANLRRPSNSLPRAAPQRRATTPPTKVASGPSAFARRFGLTEDA